MAAPRNLPAFRVAVGDTVIHERRRYTVVRVIPTVRYPRNRVDPVGHGVRLTLRPVRGSGGTSRAVAFDNYDKVRTMRAAERTAA